MARTCSTTGHLRLSNTARYLGDRNEQTPVPMQVEGCNPEKRFTASDVEYSALEGSGTSLRARAGTCYSFADWTMAGYGIVVVLANGQEFRMEIVEAV